MQRTFAEIFEAEDYPAMCHPSADPARFHVSGIDPSSARILEIGCGTGHHLLSLADRWPEATFVGLDISARAIGNARRLAERAGLKHVKFLEGDLSGEVLEGDFDVIIAHGVFSWVPDENKVQLMQLIREKLRERGYAIVSFNVAAGWKYRMPVVEKVCAIRDAAKVDEMTALQVLRDAVDGPEREIVGDMIAKGSRVLAFDDFAPVMDAWSFGAFEKFAGECELVCAGSSQESVGIKDQVDAQKGTTFRTEVLCRKGDGMSVSFSPDSTAGYQGIPPDYPKLSQWRVVCVQEGMPVPDRKLIPRRFSVDQAILMTEMDGRTHKLILAAKAKEKMPELDFSAFLQFLDDVGMFV